MLARLDRARPRCKATFPLRTDFRHNHLPPLWKKSACRLKHETRHCARLNPGMKMTNIMADKFRLNAGSTAYRGGGLEV
jgi:hypothetical protein